MDVPFNKFAAHDRELEYLRESCARGRISGDGPYTDRCRQLLEGLYGGMVLLIHSGTAALSRSLACVTTPSASASNVTQAG